MDFESAALLMQGRRSQSTGRHIEDDVAPARLEQVCQCVLSPYLRQAMQMLDCRANTDVFEIRPAAVFIRVSGRSQLAGVALRSGARAFAHAVSWSSRM